MRVQRVSDQDRQKWDRRYRETAQSPNAEVLPAPSRLLLEALAEQGWFGSPRQELTALDVACGAGRNSLALAARGFQVDALDVSQAGLALARHRSDRLRQMLAEEGDGSSAGPALLKVRWLQADLDRGLPGTDRYDLILMIRYLDLALLRALSNRLKPGGLLVAELHLQGTGEAGHAPDAGCGSLSGPRNPAFLAAPGAVLAACSGLDKLIYREGIVQSADGRREALAQYVGQRGLNEGA